jgi:hypothetical protein
VRPTDWDSPELHQQARAAHDRFISSVSYCIIVTSGRRIIDVFGPYPSREAAERQTPLIPRRDGGELQVQEMQP